VGVSSGELFWILDSVRFLFAQEMFSVFCFVGRAAGANGSSKAQCALQGFIRKVEDEKFKEVTKFGFFCSQANRLPESVNMKLHLEIIKLCQSTWLMVFYISSNGNICN